MTDETNGNGIKKDLEWLHVDMTELKSSVKSLDTEIDDFLQNKCPKWHSKINEK